MTISDILKCKSQLAKLFSYGYISPSSAMLYLISTRKKIESELELYDEARNRLLERYGTSNDGVKYELGENDSLYRKEVLQLEAHETGINIDRDKFFLNIESIMGMDAELIGAGKVKDTIGFSPNDWIAISDIIHVEYPEG
jgi:hypothetical protein